MLLAISVTLTEAIPLWNVREADPGKRERERKRQIDRRRERGEREGGEEEKEGKGEY